MDVEGVMALVERAVAEGEEEPHPGASPEQIAELQRALGFPMPGELATWLRLCNSSVGLHGIFYGTGNQRPDLNIEWHLDRHPYWRDQRWIPVADDSCGNHYVIDCSQHLTATPAAYFIDHTEDEDSLAYAVAATLPSLLRFLLEEDLEVPGYEGWPFDANYVLSKDPDLSTIKDPSLLSWANPGWRSR
ncbi:MAG: SMI1/KNR4 family protein [Carbonactinosporaceae bacterium]